MAASGLSIDLRELSSELSKTQATVAAWAKQRTEAAAQRRDAHLHAMQDQSAKLVGLKSRSVELGAAAQQVKQRVEAEAQEAGALQAAAESAQTEQEELELRVFRMRKLVQEMEEATSKAEEAERMSENARNKRLGALRKGLDIYTTRLGLQFTQTADELQLVFTQVDPRHPTRKFSIAVRVHDDKRTYTVTKCEPEICGMPALVAKLNASNDFSAFVVGARSKFRALCQQ